MNEIKMVTLIPKKPAVLSRIFFYAIGFFGLLISVPLFLSLFGIPVAILCGIGSMGFILMARGGQKVSCPYCSYNKNVVLNEKLNFRCRRCKNLIIVDWK